MHKSLYYCLVFLCTSAANAQSNSDPAPYRAGITTTDLRQHLTLIAGADMQGRETGTEGQRKAAAYIEANFVRLGLQAPAALNGYQQYYPLYSDSLVLAEATLNGNRLVLGKEYGIALSNMTNGGIKGKSIVYAGYGISAAAYDDYANINVKGKIVLFFLGEPKVGDKYLLSNKPRGSEWGLGGLSLKLQTARQKGAIAAIVINPVIDGFAPAALASMKKTNLYFPREAKPLVNGITLAHQQAALLLGKDRFDSLLQKAKLSARLDSINLPPIAANFSLDLQKERRQVMASNVLGVIEGSDKKAEYLFLTAHYDHLGMRDGQIYYGADDDGSGTCALLEMAEAFALAKAAGKGPRRTIVIMAVSGEEKGLWGSEYYCNNPVFPLDKTTADLNTDMVGRIDPKRKQGDSMNYLYVIGHDKISSDLQPINELANRESVNLELDYAFDAPNDPQRIFYRSDHYNFVKKGIPILFFFNGTHRDYHRTTDTIDKINWDLYAKRVQMIFHTAWIIANRDDMLKRDIPLPDLQR
jgi:Zn-dependent M28 family amino/carboxypeptidase